jgi:hypothetical protein
MFTEKAGAPATAAVSSESPVEGVLQGLPEGDVESPFIHLVEEECFL